MELDSIVQFFEDKTILVTGSTGFLAKMFVEKILRIQPNVKKLFLLLRGTDTKSATQRLDDEVVGTELFRVLREKWGANLNSLIAEKVLPVSGDISYEHLGIKDCDLREEMWREIDIIVNSAATTKFDGRYDVALSINAFGVLHVLNFAKKCANLKLLLHVSTAYVCGERDGLILERPFYMGETLNGATGLDIEAEKKLAEETLNDLRAEEATEKAITLAMKDLGIQRARLYGWPNTYVFTKAMGEMLLIHLKENLTVVIIRPTVITSTYKEPFPGWLEGIRTIDSFGVHYGKGKLTSVLNDPKSIIDIIPGDMAVNCIIMAIAVHANQPSEIIYHVGSSQRNPMTYANLQDFGFRYFIKNPWIDSNGKLVKVGKLLVFSTMASFRFYMAIRYSLPLKVLQLVNVALFQHLESTCLNLNRETNSMIRLAELYRPYLFFKGIFDDTNTERLRMAAEESNVEVDMFYFDPKSVDWEDYFINIHLPGIVKYLF
uniref:Fatty acyl-CoA reductase n=1 Tax=Davidia involucrata TaxID=16924 RepID=A0A5B7B1U0_DAVIN